MKTKLSGFLLFALLGNLMGCQQVSEKSTISGATNTAKAENIKVEMTPKEQEIVNKLQWVKTANAKAAAKTALSVNGKPELIAFSGRSMSFPGLTHAQYESIKDHVTYQFSEHGGDVIYGDTHKALRKQLRGYVSEYNKIIYSSLLEEH